MCDKCEIDMVNLKEVWWMCNEHNACERCMLNLCLVCPISIVSASKMGYIINQFVECSRGRVNVFSVEWVK